MDFQQVFNNLSERGRLEWELAVLRTDNQALQATVAELQANTEGNGTSEA